MLPLPYPRFSVRLDVNGRYTTGGTHPSFRGDGAVDPESQKYPIGHGICTVTFEQKNPTAHLCSIVLSCGQYEPEIHCCTVDGELQTLPAGQGISCTDPC